jgi:hypothetical protein
VKLRQEKKERKEKIKPEIQTGSEEALCLIIIASTAQDVRQSALESGLLSRVILLRFEGHGEVVNDPVSEQLGNGRVDLVELPRLSKKGEDHALVFNERALTFLEVNHCCGKRM